jgi:hypothetical protein
MATIATPGASAPKLVTEQTTFFQRNPQGEHYFAVCAGVPMSAALNQAACLLCTLNDLAYVAADEADSSILHAITNLAEMAKALVEAVIHIDLKRE